MPIKTGSSKQPTCLYMISEKKKKNLFLPKLDCSSAIVPIEMMKLDPELTPLLRINSLEIFFLSQAAFQFFNYNNTTTLLFLPFK